MALFYEQGAVSEEAGNDSYNVDGEAIFQQLVVDSLSPDFVKG